MEALPVVEKKSIASIALVLNIHLKLFAIFHRVFQ
jgi:hypothetical protein